MDSPITQALAAINSRNSIRAVAKAFQIPESTLRLHRKKPNLRQKRGRPAMFDELEEAALEDLILLSSDMFIGMGRTKFLVAVAVCSVERCASRQLTAH